MTEIKNNLFGIKWPRGVDMPLNKTQTQTPVALLRSLSGKGMNPLILPAMG